MKINSEPKLDFDDVLIVPQRSSIGSRRDVNLKRKFKFYHSQKQWYGTPIMASNMVATGTFSMSAELMKYGMVTCLHKHYEADKLAAYYEYYDAFPYTWVSLGMSSDGEAFQNIDVVAQKHGFYPNICIDVANGYTEYFVDYCKAIRQSVGGNPIIMAGNVCTPDMVTELILHGGVDIVKVGIGPGSACTTRLKTGVGYPQLSAIAECAHAAHGLRKDTGRLGLICADGGCRTAGDVAKAYGAGADFVMLGGMFAGTNECEGDVNDGVFTFYGMSSEMAQDKHGNGLKEYRASEGRVIEMPSKGPVQDVVRDIQGGVRSACTYTGVDNLKDFAKACQFVKVNRTHFDQSV